MKKLFLIVFSTILFLIEGICGDQLCCDQQLPIGGTISSPNGQYSLIFQRDGNLVLYRSNGVDLWASNTSGRKVTTCMMQSDGNLVLYDNNTPIWNSKTFGNPNSKLILQDDGNLVIYDQASKPIWDSKTVHIDGHSQIKIYGSDQLAPSEHLRMNFGIKSGNGTFSFQMQMDGNLVLYQHCRTGAPIALWDSKTNGKGADRCIFSANGHLQILKGETLLANFPDNKNDYYYSVLFVQGDGNVVIYDSNNKPVWVSNTKGIACPAIDVNGDCVLTGIEPFPCPNSPAMYTRYTWTRRSDNSFCHSEVIGNCR